MFSRISDALGCPISKNYSSSADDDGCWLSTSVQNSTSFVLPAPTLQDTLRKMCISYSIGFGKLYFDRFQSEPQTPWGVAHSARSRCKLADELFRSSSNTASHLVQELRSLAANCNEQASSHMVSFSALLIPLFTARPDDVFDTCSSEDDILILFGSPASVFQLLLSIPSLTGLMTELVFELIAGANRHSEQLLFQFRQPIGLGTMFTSKNTLMETGTHLLELFPILTSPHLQSGILRLLPDLIASPCATNDDKFNEGDLSVLVIQLLDLMRNVPISGKAVATISAAADAAASDPMCCLMECLNNFTLSGELHDRFADACFDLLDRCYTDDSYFAYLPVVSGCLLIRTSATDTVKLVTRMRRYFRFPRFDTVLDAPDICAKLVEVLRMAFQFNRTLISE